MPLIPNLDINFNSKKLKELASVHDSDIFLADIATLLTQIDTPRIKIHPFQGLDSPFRQLSYLAALNLTADPSLVKNTGEVKEQEWFDMVKHFIAAKAGYFDLLLPKEGDDPITFHDLYKIAMPVFMDFYGAGSLNYEEQDIERVIAFFTPYDSKIKTQFGLLTIEFVEIYNLIDRELNIQLNIPLTLMREDKECKAYFDKLMAEKINPLDWEYDGTNENIIALVKYGNSKSERFSVSLDILKEKYDPNKLDVFFAMFTIKRDEGTYLFFTEQNPVLTNPIFKLKNGNYLIISIKQLITAIYTRLTLFAIDTVNGFNDNFYALRGKILQTKIEELFKRYSKNQAFVYNEYSTSLHGDGQDILVLWKSLAFIIEAKAGKELEPMRDVKKSFSKILIGFKRNIQEGYDQAYRVKQLFDKNEKFDIYDKKGNKVYNVVTTKYNEYFPIIVTLSKFRKPQIDLNLMLDLNEDDDRYPFSVSIDDLEIILLTMMKLKKGPGELVKFLKWRELLQGRLDCNDELELWGAFINNKNFEVPADDRYCFKTFPEMADFYDTLYEKGLGFKNEKDLDKKRSDRWLTMNPAVVRNAANAFEKKHLAQ